MAMYQLGKSRPPRTAARRVGWMVVTLGFLGVVVGFMLAGAISNWFALGRGVVPAPDLSETVLLTLLGVVGAVLFMVTLVLGVRRVREQRAVEQAVKRDGRN